jgi:hypothetical protein
VVRVDYLLIARAATISSRWSANRSMNLATPESRIACRSAIALLYISSSASRVWVGSGSTYGGDAQN